MSIIPYDVKKLRALVFDIDGVLSKETITLSSDGEPLRTVNIKDGYAIQHAVKKGLILAIISGGNSRSLRLRYEGLGMTEIYLSASKKIDTYKAFLEKNNLKDDEVLYMGDDIPDYEVMRTVGCSCCPHDAAREIQDISTYVCSRNGGEGCVREVIEIVLKEQGKWMSDSEAFGW